MVASNRAAINMQSPFADYLQRLTALTRQLAIPTPDPLFDDLAQQLFRLQFQHVAPYAAFAQTRSRTPETVKRWQEIPAVPTSAFKDQEWTSLAPAERTRVFLSSGTTTHRPSRHYHDSQSLALYEASALPWFQHHLQADRASAVRPLLIALTPDPAAAPHSSLVHMLETVRRAGFEADAAYTGALDTEGNWILNTDRLSECLLQATQNTRPVLLLGTAFGFVTLLDHLASRRRRWTLPPGSRVMETGGYKGRSRVLPKAALHQGIQQCLGIPSSHIVTEYGMTELSSQAYDHIAGQPEAPGSRLFRFPPWARAWIVSPETGQESAPGETGILHVVDLANVRSVAFLQTDDLAIRRHDGFEWVGRISDAEPRGCSLLQHHAGS
jgi:hypothetical protein